MSTFSNPIGRLHIPDVRDRNFMMQVPAIRDSEGDEADQRGWRYWFPHGWWGDQFFTPQCVAFAWLHWLEDGPTTHEDRAAVYEVGQGQPLFNPQVVYDWAQRNDYWPSEDYDGTSVRAGAKYLREQGRITEFRWVYDVDTLERVILLEGPAVAGTNWYDSMFDPDSKGVITVDGAMAGGHAYKVDGVNRKRQLFRIKNSWGRKWGNDGFGYISYKDMSRLLAENGEVCVAIEKEAA